jgi:hypothetical protein
LQAANIMVAIGGDRGHTVPKFGVSATEISILQAIHGPGSIYDVEPVDNLKDEDGKPVRGRDELARLRQVYDTEAGKNAFAALYPGIGAKAVEDLDDLDIPEENMKAVERVKAPPAPNTKEEKASRKRQEAVDKATEAGVARPQNAEDAEDGIGDMPASGVLS